MEREEFVRFMENVYSDVFENLKVEKIPDYFSPSYIQLTAGDKIDYRGFIKHMSGLKERVKSIEDLPFEDIVLESNKIVLKYTSKVTRKNDLESKFAVLAIFEIEIEKLVRCWELTKIILGKKEDELSGIT